MTTTLERSCVQVSTIELVLLFFGGMGGGVALTALRWNADRRERAKATVSGLSAALFTVGLVVDSLALFALGGAIGLLLIGIQIYGGIASLCGDVNPIEKRLGGN